MIKPSENRKMKRKNQKSKNVKLRMTLKKTIELPQQMVEDKKVHSNLKIMKKMKNKDQVCESTKTPQRNLRTRTVKNYSEKSKVVNFKPKKKEVSRKSPVIKSDTERIPIYKTVDLFEEKAKSPEEIYEFIDDSPVSDQKVKKRVRKYIIKQGKKLTGLKYDRLQRSKTKQINNISKNVQLKEQEKQSINNNSVTFQLNIQESNESNHSLIKQPISPITKEVDNLSIESPNSIDTTFSQVQKVVQSTPLSSRVLEEQEKKSLLQIMNKNNEKFTEKNLSDIIQDKEKNVSPRKFGTEISNLNSMEHADTSSIKQVSPLQIQQLPLNTVLSPISFENNINDQEIQNDSLPMSSILTIDNRKDNTLSPNESLKKKVDQLTSPLRFENIIKSFKQIDSNMSKNNAENSNSQKENKNPNLADKLSGSETTKTVVLRQSNLNNFLNLDEMPESTCISTAHGIFDDIKNCIYSEKSSLIKKKSISKIATAKDVARSVKGKLFLKARIKSSLAKRLPENLIKKTLLKNITMKNIEIAEESRKSKNNAGDENEKSSRLVEDENEINTSHMENVNEMNIIPMEDENEISTSHFEKENEMTTSHFEDENEMNTSNFEDENEKNTDLKDLENNNISFDLKKAFLDSVSFSDTFDFLSEIGEDVSSKVPNEIPMFIDHEPAHFSQPPRRSYMKTKKAICSKTSRRDSKHKNYKEEELDEPKKKKKKASRLSKEEQKKMQQWIKSVNETFDEIDQFNLTVE